MTKLEKEIKAALKFHKFCCKEYPEHRHIFDSALLRDITRKFKISKVKLK